MSEFKFSMEELTIGDMRQIKRMAKEQLDVGWTAAQSALAEGDPDMLAIVALIVKRKGDPSATLDGVDAMKLSSLVVSDPTTAAGSKT